MQFLYITWLSIVHWRRKNRDAGWRNDPLHNKKDDNTLIENTQIAFQKNLDMIMAGDGIPQTTVIDCQNDSWRIIKPVVRPTKHGIDNVHFIDRASFKQVRVIGDVHGNMDGLRKAVDTAKPNTFFVFLGDILDYGPNSIQCVDKVANLINSGKAVTIRGNHERKMERYFTSVQFNNNFAGQITHGNQTTIDEFDRMKKIKQTRWLRKHRDVYESSFDWLRIGDYFFVHGGFHPTMMDLDIQRALHNSSFEARALYGQTDGVFVER